MYNLKKILSFCLNFWGTVLPKCIYDVQKLPQIEWSTKVVTLSPLENNYTISLPPDSDVAA